jgi:hypothetical protein
VGSATELEGVLSRLFLFPVLTIEAKLRLLDTRCHQGFKTAAGAVFETGKTGPVNRKERFAMVY